MITIYMIRHGETMGNLEKRYIGSTDESLCAEGLQRLEQGKKASLYPQASRVYVSPMKRCVESAECLFPSASMCMVEGFREMDFGKFEGKNYEELRNDPAYRIWIDAVCAGKTPEDYENEGDLLRASLLRESCVESQPEFVSRNLDSFNKILRLILERKQEKPNFEETICFVVHGGTIMSILSNVLQGCEKTLFRISEKGEIIQKMMPREGGYYDFQIKNGECIRIDFDT